MNTIGTLYKLTTFGESHGAAIGGIIDGLPGDIEIDLNKVQQELDRRKPGTSSITTQRKEDDKLEILSGIFNGRTTGTPLAFLVRNEDHHSNDYEEVKNTYRPNHADFTYDYKYHNRDYRGGGRASARETISRVVAGAIAKQILEYLDVEIFAYTSQIGNIKLNKPYYELDLTKTDTNDVRCPDKATANRMIKKIKEVRDDGNSIGGIVTCVIKGLQPGIGEPIFDKLSSRLAGAIMSIPGTKGFEYGEGFGGVTMLGSEYIDEFKVSHGEITTKTNHSGGIQGGISNGQDIYFNVVFKPTATIYKEVNTVDVSGEEKTLKMVGRHDPCIVPRAIPIVESMVAITLLDLILIENSRK